MYNFYALIIGSEILNGRRKDLHFEFLKTQLQKYNHTLFASFVIKDDIQLIESTMNLIKNDKNSILFSFGGIGSTPDDMTREIASKVFRDSSVIRHDRFFQDIIEKFGDEAYPHRIHMADIPPQSELIKNPVNNMSGFSLDDRFFFVPGFPSMAHPMLSDIIDTKFSKKVQKYRKTLLAHTSENYLIDVMKLIPIHVELSSLPIFKDGRAQVEISLLGDDEDEIIELLKLFEDKLNSENVYFCYI
jgi:molybdopterin-biosynthesis enzyme MoeA-like protein